MPLQVGSTQLRPGNYKVEWYRWVSSRTERSWSRVPATLKTADNEVTQDAVLTDKANADIATLKEIDVGGQKESLVFDQNSGGKQLLETMNA